MKGFVALFKQFILRALIRDRVRAGVTALGISLGVGVMIAIRLANTSALESFRAATESVAGETSIQIRGAAGRFDELLIADLGWLADYGQASPVIAGHARTERGEYLEVLGVDVLRDRSLRRYRLLRLSAERAEPNTREFLLLLADPRAIILTEKFARRNNLSIGSLIPLTIGDTRTEFVVRGLLADEGPARSLDNFALMDIAAAQLAFDRLGLLDRLDVKLKPEVSREQAEAEIARRLPERLMAVEPDAAYGQVERMISAFHFNLSALSSIALLVGLFLIYNTVSISVITRREEIGALRAIGVGRRMVLALFLGEAVLLAAVGTIIGIVAGRLMAGAAVRATATTVETFYIAASATDTIARQTLGFMEVAIAFAVALPLAIIAATVPAIEASRVRPVEAMRGAERLAKSFRPSKRNILIAVALFAVGFALSRLEAIDGLPVFGYIAGLALMFGGAFLVPTALWLTCRAAARVSGRMFRAIRVEGRLASANLLGAIPRVSISVAALAVSLAMMVAISIMIGSFRETVTYWLGQTFKADIYAKPVAQTRGGLEGSISVEAIELIKADPDVAAVDAYTSEDTSYAGNPITLGAGDFRVLLDYGKLFFKAPADAEARMNQAIGADAVVVSESFAILFKKEIGDWIELSTPSGPRPFQIAAIYYDYSSNRGAVVMDRSTYARHFPASLNAAPSTLSIYLRPGANEDRVKERLIEATGSRYQIIFTTSAAVRREVMRIFDSTFAITYALEVIAIAVAGLGVISTLITLILERRGEIAVLSFIGATRAQIRRMIVIEAVLIGGVSQTVGVLIGLMLSLVLIYVINVQSFGWTIQFHFPALFIIQSTLLILVVTALAGLYPAARAARVEAVRFAREE
ncbi:MAG TPA: FtsX-like permease family protein [Blastocatellia bacterium]|nr:FtsX-like permease family protein [Blastocatellia bacterium]